MTTVPQIITIIITIITMIMDCRVYWSKTAYQQSLSDCESNHKKTKIAFSKTPQIASFYITTGKTKYHLQQSKVKLVNGTANAELVLQLQIFPSWYNKTNLVSLKTSYEIIFDKYSGKSNLRILVLQSFVRLRISSCADAIYLR